MQVDKIPLGSFLTAEATTRAYHGWDALDVLTGDKFRSARAPRQRAGLTTRPGAHAHGLPQQHRNDDDDDEPEQLTDSAGRSDGDDDGGEETGVERSGRETAQRKAAPAGVTRGSRADCARYIGVGFDERRKAVPFRASIHFKSKKHTICRSPTADAAARAYDTVACMIPGRALNFPTLTPAAASSSRPRKGASAVPAESAILAAIAALREAQLQSPPTGAVKYVGVSMDKTSACNQYRARIKVNGKQKDLGHHPTAKSAARAYDAAARTISGRKLNFPTGGSSAAAACEGSRKDPQSLPSHGAGQPSQPLRGLHDDAGSPCTEASAQVRKRKQPSSSS
jgi:hypothetical protein